MGTNSKYYYQMLVTDWEEVHWELAFSIQVLTLRSWAWKDWWRSSAAEELWERSEFVEINVVTNQNHRK